MRSWATRRHEPVHVPPDFAEVNAAAGSLAELLAAAGRARQDRQPLRITGIAESSLEDLMRIAVAGGDCVVFAETERAATPAGTTPRRWFARRRG